MVGMSSTIQYEPREKSVKIAKGLFGLSLLLPYLITYTGPDTFDTLMVYAPIWIVGRWGKNIAGGPSPMALIMFLYWLPYVLIGYQAYRYAKGRCSSEKSYLLSILLLIILSLFLLSPFYYTPTGYTNGDYVYPLYLPLPIIPVLALLSVRLLRPTKIKVPWTEKSEPVDSTHNEESIWTD